MSVRTLPPVRLEHEKIETKAGENLAPWEREALHKLRLLRQSGKPAILYVTDSGAILVFRGEPAGRIAP